MHEFVSRIVQLLQIPILNCRLLDTEEFCFVNESRERIDRIVYAEKRVLTLLRCPLLSRLRSNQVWNSPTLVGDSIRSASRSFQTQHPSSWCLDCHDVHHAVVEVVRSLWR